MSNNYKNNQIKNFIKRNNDIISKKKLDITSISNNNKIIYSKLNNFISNCFSKTTKNSPRSKHTPKISKSFNLKYYSKQDSKTNLKIENSLDSKGGLKKFKFKTKNINLNIKTINMNLELKKYPYGTKTENVNCINENENANDLSFIKNNNLNNKNKFHNLQYQIYEKLNNSKKEKEHTVSNETFSRSPFKHYKNNSLYITKNKSRISNTLYRLNKSKESLNKEKISPIKNKMKFFSIKKKYDINNQKKNNKLFNSIKNTFIKRTTYKIKKNNEDYIDKIKSKKLFKDATENSTPKINNEKLKINNKTKFNEISFNNIPKIFQFNNKKQTRNFNYHKKQPSFSSTKTSNISQCNFLESNSLDNMLNQITNNKSQINSSNYNNSTNISNEKYSQHNNAISMSNKLIQENNDLVKENIELKRNNYKLYNKIKEININLNALKNIINSIIFIYKHIFNNIVNKYKEKEKEMKYNLNKYQEYIKQIIFYNKYYSMIDINNNTKMTKIIHQTLTENKILRNLYNNLLLFDLNNARINTNPSENMDENEYKDNIKISLSNISFRSNRFLEEENGDSNINKKRSDTAEQKKCDIIDIIGGNKHSQSRNYDIKNELNTNIKNNNQNLQKFFVKKLNYKIKK